MKKLLTIALLLVDMTASAQGVWSTGTNEADELIGIKGGRYYYYDVEGMGAIALWDWNGWNFKLFSHNGSFDTWVIKGSANTVYYTSMLIGIYDSSGALVEKFKDDIEVDYNQHGKYACINKNWAYTPAKRKKLRKAIQAMKSGDGYVRIVCERRGKPNFDLKITPYDLQEEIIDEDEDKE
jgi:hypothetical protein